MSTDTASMPGRLMRASFLLFFDALDLTKAFFAFASACAFWSSSAVPPSSESSSPPPPPLPEVIVLPRRTDFACFKYACALCDDPFFPTLCRTLVCETSSAPPVAADVSVMCVPRPRQPEL